MRIIITFLAALLFAGQVWGQTTMVRQQQFNLKKGVAIEGYDPVSYFHGKPKEGTDKLSYMYNGVTYRFATAQNMATFKSNPAAYEPQYGGWCAYAMGAKGQKVEVDPETYKIVSGKLYLFYNKYFNNTRDSWNKDEPHLASQADENWKKIFHP